MLDHSETSSSFFKDSTKFPMYRVRPFPLQEEKFHHASLPMILDFDPLDAHFDGSVGRKFDCGNRVENGNSNLMMHL
jgi:hypothetical protein